MLYKTNVIFLVFIVLFAVFLGCQATGSNTSYGNRVGNLAPDFTLNDLSGNPVSLSGLIGKPVVVHFWSTT
jgi:cytochrome oxidase Cu insertion factor (SCO1/SenC/PrrC family)